MMFRWIKDAGGMEIRAHVSCSREYEETRGVLNGPGLVAFSDRSKEPDISQK